MKTISTNKFTPKALVLMLCILLSFTAISNTPIRPNSFIIKGELKNIDQDIWVKLQLKGTDQAVDSVRSKNGQFVFNGTVETPALYILTFVKNQKEENGRPPYQPNFELFLENSAIALTIDLAQLPNTYPETFQKPDAYKTVKVKGSSAHAQYMAFKSTQDPLDKFRSALFMDKYIAYLNPKPGEIKGPMHEGIAIVNEIDIAAAKAKKNSIAFIQKNSDNYVGLMVAKNRIAKFDAVEIDAITNGFSARIKKSTTYKDYVTYAEKIKRSAPGSKFIDFNFKDHKGNAVKLSDHVGKGKYVLLEFWASWCGPCRADIPHLKEAYEAFHPAGFEVISVSMDDNKEKWLEAIEEEQMTWLQVSDLKAFNGELNKLYNFQGIPTCVLIDPKGNIVTRNMRGSWMDARLIKMYGNKFAAKK